jgi:glutathione S-transferase
MTELGNCMMQYLYHGLDTPFSYKPKDRSRACAEYNQSQFDRGLDALQARLRNREFLAGAFSLVDIPAASLLLVGNMFGIEFNGHPRVAEWLERCRGRPAFERAR